jgi:hypothetical protein
LSTAAMPPMRPPPPTGTMQTSTLPCGIWLSISTATLPWPTAAVQACANSSSSSSGDNDLVHHSISQGAEAASQLQPFPTATSSEAPAQSSKHTQAWWWLLGLQVVLHAAAKSLSQRMPTAVNTNSTLAPQPLTTTQLAPHNCRTCFSQP